MNTQEPARRPEMDPDPTRQAPPVVVGVDGSTYNESAVEWAAAEAARTGRELRLVTTTGVFTEPVPHRTAGVIDSFDYGAHYTEMLARIARDVRLRHPGLRVVPWVRSGDPMSALADMSRERDVLVVVGKRGLGAFRRVLVGSTSIAVVGRVSGPVVVVPDGWDVSATAGLPIVVGVDFENDSGAVLGFAFGRAADLGVPVLAVHAWRAHAWIPLSDDERGRHALDAKRGLEDALASWRLRYPEVVVHSDQIEGHPAQALLDASDRAELLVLGRTSDAHPLTGLPFGSVARAVLHYSERPVVVVPDS